MSKEEMAPVLMELLFYWPQTINWPSNGPAE